MIAIKLNGTWATLVLVSAMGLLAAGCGSSSSKLQSSGPPEPDGRGAGAGPGGPSGPRGPSSADVLAKLPGGDEFATAKKVYANNNCARCHKLGETGGGPPAPKGGAQAGEKAGGPGGKGPRGGMVPDLTTVGADAKHTKEWITEHIRNPKAHTPQSRMPASGPEKISDADLDALAAYLASRK
jgi:mono/diheme cytochrome c family protein